MQTSEMKISVVGGVCGCVASLLSILRIHFYPTAVEGQIPMSAGKRKEGLRIRHRVVYGNAAHLIQ